MTRVLLDGNRLREVPGLVHVVSPERRQVIGEGGARNAAPDELRQRLAPLSVKALVNEAARLRPRGDGDPVLSATKTAAVTLARRIHGLDAELALLDTQIEP